MTTPARWEEWANPDPVALTEFLEACDRDLGHEPIEVTADEVSGFLQPGASRRLTQGPTTVGIASVIPGHVALVRVSRSASERDRVLEAAISWLAPRVGDGALWLPDGDAAGAAAAQAAGFEREYTDIQMARAVPLVESPEPPPPGFAVSDLDSTQGSSLRAVHDLVCRTWSVDPHWLDFKERFASSMARPSLWVLLTPTSGASAGRLVAAAWGSFRPSDEGPVGVVEHLDVDPDHRRQGLGPWALNEVARRFRVLDARVRSARLGVHDDNANKAQISTGAWVGWRCRAIRSGPSLHYGRRPRPLGSARSDT